MRSQFKGRLNTRNTVPFRTGDFRDRRSSDQQKEQTSNDSVLTGNNHDDLKTLMESTNIGEELFRESDLEYVYKPRQNDFQTPKQTVPKIRENVTVIMEEPKDEYFWSQSK